MIFLSDASDAVRKFQEWAEGLAAEQRKWVLVGVIILVVSIVAGNLGTYAILALFANGIVWMMLLESEKACVFMHKHGFRVDVAVHIIAGGGAALTAFGMGVGIFTGIFFTIFRKVLISSEKSIPVVVVERTMREVYA